MPKSLLFSCLLALCGSAAAQALTAQHEAVLREVRGSGKTVKDALWTQPTILKLGVLDDGTVRDGLALHACEVIASQGMKSRGIWVQVIDVAKLKRTGKWVKLGEARCQ